MSRFSFIFRMFVIFSLMSIAPHSFASDVKVALIIGNSAYSGNMFDSLPTPVNDAEEIKGKLEGLGFRTIVIYDASKSEILGGINDFGEILQGADVGVFFYSGHAAVIGEEHYIIPSRDQLHQEILPEECVSIGTIRSLMERRCRLSLLFLDACRNAVPSEVMYGTKGMSVPSGIGRKSAERKAIGSQTFYATGRGRTATTGYGKLSPFTESLSRHLFDDDEFRSVWATIQAEVYAHSGQTPTSEGSYQYDYYFTRSGRQSSSSEVVAQPSAPTVSPAPPVRYTNPAENYNLAVKYRDGVGVMTDPSLAFRYMKMAAEAGYKEAFRPLAEMYHGGRGVAKDRSTAEFWYRKAANAGDKIALRRLNNM